MKYCRKCGAELAENASFCTKCGERIKKPRLRLNFKVSKEAVISKTKNLWTSNKRFRWGVLVVLVALVLCIPYLNNKYQNHRALSTVNKIYNSKPAVKSLSESYNIRVDSRTKTVKLYPQEDILNQIGPMSRKRTI